MSNLFSFLSQLQVIIICFISMLIIGFIFSFAPEMVGGELLDLLYTETEAKARLLEMSAEQKHYHLLYTIILDSFYPIAYGGLLIGVASKFSGERQLLATLPAIVTVVSDFTENLMHTFALLEFENFLVLKDVLTPLKFYAFTLAALIALLLALIAFIKWAYQRIRA